MKTIRNTIVKKSVRGWIAETIVEINSHHFKITTMKRHHGKITCRAQSGKFENKNGYGKFSFSLVGDKLHQLAVSDTNRATEKAIRNTHEFGIRLLERTEIGFIKNHERKVS